MLLKDKNTSTISTFVKIACTLVKLRQRKLFVKDGITTNELNYQGQTVFLNL